MSDLERINNGPLFRVLNSTEAATVLGGSSTVNTFIRNGDGSLSYVGQDLVIEPT